MTKLILTYYVFYYFSVSPPFISGLFHKHGNITAVAHFLQYNNYPIIIHSLVVARHFILLSWLCLQKHRKLLLQVRLKKKEDSARAHVGFVMQQKGVPFYFAVYLKWKCSRYYWCREKYLFQGTEKKCNAVDLFSFCVCFFSCCSLVMLDFAVPTPTCVHNVMQCTHTHSKLQPLKVKHISMTIILAWNG